MDGSDQDSAANRCAVGSDREGLYVPASSRFTVMVIPPIRIETLAFHPHNPFGYPLEQSNN